MKTQTVWVCQTKTGAIARDESNNRLLAFTLKADLIGEIRTRHTRRYRVTDDIWESETAEEVLKRKSWRIAKARLILEEREMMKPLSKEDIKGIKDDCLDIISPTIEVELKLRLLATIDQRDERIKGLEEQRNELEATNEYMHRMLNPPLDRG